MRLCKAIFIKHGLVDCEIVLKILQSVWRMSHTSPDKKRLKQTTIGQLFSNIKSKKHSESKVTNLSKLQEERRLAAKKKSFRPLEKVNPAPQSPIPSICVDNQPSATELCPMDVDNQPTTSGSRLLDQLQTIEDQNIGSEISKEANQDTGQLDYNLNQSESVEMTFQESCENSPIGLNSLDWFECTESYEASNSAMSMVKNERLQDQHSEEVEKSNIGESSTKQDLEEVQESQPTWFGKPYEELKLMTHKTNKFDSASNHWLLYQGNFDGRTPPSPFSHPYVDQWDSHHVRLPCSPQNKYAGRSTNGGSQSTLCQRWEMIETSLLMGLSSSVDIEEAILNYNSRYADQWTFRSLNTFFTEFADPSYSKKFFDVTLPKMVGLALQLQSLFKKPIPLLSQHRNGKISMTQQQVACLLCNAFFCTFPRRNSRHRESEYINYPLINFNHIFQGANKREKANLQKIKTLLHYFDRVTNEMPSGTITYERRSMDEFPTWSRSPLTLGDFHVRSQGMIEDAHGMLQMDFANKSIGGGVLRTGLVQEEIRFCVCPELIASMLFMERMDHNECILITGAEQFSSFTGYAETYEWAGDHVDTTPRDNYGRRICQIVALDATRYKRSSDQYPPTSVLRELNKAYCGFSYEDPDDAPAVATGNWGCGAFGGNPLMKGLIQLMAASAAGRQLCYFTFNDANLASELHQMWNFIREKKLRIRDLWAMMCNFHKDRLVQKGKKTIVQGTISDYIQKSYEEYQQSTDEEQL